MKIFLAFITIAYLWTDACAQEGVSGETSSEISIENILEGFESEDIGQSDFYTILKSLEDNPININTASAKTFRKIPFIDAQTAKKIVKYRKENGSFSHQDSLLNVPRISVELLSAITPYITLKRPRKKPLLKYQVRLKRNLFNTERYTTPESNNRYYNPYYLLHRLKWDSQKGFSAGITWEKDAGEQRWADFGAFYFRYNRPKSNSQFLFGDYNLVTGAKQVFSTAYGTSRAINSFIPFTRSGIRWKAKNASDENAFLRGLLWEQLFQKNYILIVALSNHKIDASVSDDSLTANSIVSFPASGYHRTETERNREKQLSEISQTVSLSRTSTSVELGLQYARFSYSNSIIFKDNFIEQKLHYYSGFYSFSERALFLSGEATLLEGKYPAITQRLFISSLKSKFKYGGLIYYYHPQYWAYHGRAFGSTGNFPNNEMGYYLQTAFQIASKTNIAAYFHTNRQIAPSDDFSFLNHSIQFELNQQINKSTILARYSRKLRERYSAIVAPGQTTNIIRAHLRTRVSKTLRLMQRIEFSFTDSVYNENKSFGISLYLDARYQPSQSLTLHTRWTQFDIPDYDLRLYEFENDLPGSFQNTLLNSRGFKWYLLIGYKLGKTGKFSIKYQEIYYPDAITLGSGLDEIRSNKKNALKIQWEFAY